MRLITTGLIPPPRPTPPVKSITLLADPSDPQMWILTVRNVSPITGVKVDARYDLEKILAAGTTVDDRTRARLAARAEKVAAEIEKHFEGDFAAQRETVLIADELEAMLARLGSDERVEKPLEPRLEDGVLIYPIIIKPTVKTLVGSGGISYTPHEGFTGTAGLTEQNLFGLNEDASVDVKGGPHTQRGDFNLGIPIPASWLKDDRLAARGSLHGLYTRIDDAVLGQPESATVTEEENSVRVRHSLTFLPLARRSMEKAPSQTLALSESTTFGIDLEFGRRDVNLRGVVAPAGIPTDGVTAPLTVAFRGSTGVEPRDRTEERVRKVDLRLESAFEHSFAILGSDLQYDRWDVRASIEGLFWLFSTTPHNDVLVRYVHGVGITSGGTPLFRFFRVGGESNVRGVEEGEFIGRRLHFQQIEAGVSLCALQQLIVGRVGGAGGGPADDDTAAKPTPAERGCQAGGLDLARVFVKFFGDHADIAEQADGQQFERASRSIFGVGVALELHDLQVGNQRRLSLSLGYAYSPDSQRHSSGTVFTQVVMPFGLR